MSVKYFCINLDKRKDRWERVQKIFQKEEMPVDRWSAKPLPENRRFGAWLSHREIIEYAQKNKWNYVWVFEDDIRILRTGLKKKIKSALESLEWKEWYILYLWWSIGRNWSLQRNRNIPSLLRVRWLFEAHAVIYSKRFFDIYLEKHPPIYTHDIEECYLDNKYRAFDQWFANVVQYEYPCYITKTILLTQEDDFSNIENKFVNRHIKSIYRFYTYKYLWSKIGTFLETYLSKLKQLIEYYRKKFIS